MEDLGGLLHFAAVVIAVTGGYIGLDKLGHEKVKYAFDQIDPQIAATKEKTQGILVKLDLMRNGVAVLHPIFGMYPQYFICLISGVPHSIPWYWRWYCVMRRQIDVPLLAYFRKRHDVWLISLMLIIGLVSFFLLVAATVWHLNWMDEKFTRRALYWIYLASTIWVVLSLTILRRCLSTVDKKCEMFYEKIEKTATDNLETLLKTKLI